MQRGPYSPDGLDGWLSTLQVSLLYAAYTTDDLARDYWVQSGFNRVIRFHGTGNRYLFGRDWIIPETGDILLIPANTRVRVQLAAGHAECFAAFTLRIAPGGDMMNLLEQPDHLIRAADCPTAAACLDRLVQAYQSTVLPTRLLGIADILSLSDHWLRHLDRDLLRRRRSQFDRLEPAMKLIHDDITQPITLDDLAAATGLSAKYVCNRFSEIMGIGPMAYLAQRRLEHAAHLLISTDDRIGEIAAAVGYSDPYHFSRAFKRQHGLSPRAWRRQTNRDRLA